MPEPLSTTISGVEGCEHLPRLAHQANRLAILRTLSHREHNHLLATQVALTGRSTPVPRGGSDPGRVETRSDFPNFASALDFVRPRSDGIPTGVSLPNYLVLPLKEMAYSDGWPILCYQSSISSGVVTYGAMKSFDDNRLLKWKLEILSKEYKVLH